MEISDIMPVVVFDNRCYLCVKFARAVEVLARGRLSMVGHYTPLGERIRNELLDESALEMFWLIKGKNAYGGRAALPHLVASILSPGGKGRIHGSVEECCGKECKTAKSVFLRSSSLLTRSKRIPLVP